MLVVGNTVPSGHTAGRIFDTEGISPTVMYRNSKVVQILENSHKPMLVGGIGEKNFGKQFRQGNRVYDSNAIAMCLHSQPVGNAGGYSYLYTVDNHLPAVLKYQRTEYAKQIRKDYESGKIKERRCNMREYTLRTDGLCNTITTVQKDNYIAVGAAMRGRYDKDGKTEQQLELRDDEISNALTTVQKDNYIVENFQKPPMN